MDTLKPGERFGLGGGWPPMTVERDIEGRYWLSSIDSRREITEDEAFSLIDDWHWRQNEEE